MAIDLVKEVCNALDAAGSYFSANPQAGWTDWTAQTHSKVGDVAAHFALSEGISSWNSDNRLS